MQKKHMILYFLIYIIYINNLHILIYKFHTLLFVWWIPEFTKKKYKFHKIK